MMMFQRLWIAALLLSANWSVAASPLPTYPFWSSSHTDETVMPSAGEGSRELQLYQQEATKLDCATAIVPCLTLYGQHLESQDPIVAMQAFVQLSTQPYEVLRDNVSKLPLAKLRKLALNRKIPIERRDFYCFVLGLKKLHADRSIISEVLDEFLSKESLQDKPMVGVLLGYALSGSNYAQQMYMKTLKYNAGKRTSQMPMHPLNVLHALAFLKEHEPALVQTWTKSILKAALQREVPLTELAFQLASRWQIPELSGDVLTLVQSGKQDEAWLLQAKNYCEEIASDSCQQTLQWLATHHPQLGAMPSEASETNEENRAQP